jgi:Flp pilus assembly protein TadG
MLAEMKSRIAQHLRSVRQLDGGVAGVEFAILCPWLVMLMVCTADVGLGIYAKMRVQNAAQVGAQYAAYHGFDTAAISSAVAQAVNFSGLALSPSPYAFCGCPTSSGVVGSDCASVCPDTLSPGHYITVSSQGTYSTLLPYPGMPQSFTFTSQSTVRVE